MNNKNYIMCLDCGNIQVRTDITIILENGYTLLRHSQIACSKCVGKNHIATHNIKALSKKLESKSEPTSLEKKILYLAKKERI